VIPTIRSIFIRAASLPPNRSTNSK
jgi:hypothetical protein